MLGGDNGIINKASESKEKNRATSIKESVDLALMEKSLGGDSPSKSEMINQLFRSFMTLNVDSDVFLHTGEAGIHEWIVTDKVRLIVMTNYQRKIKK